MIRVHLAGNTTFVGKSTNSIARNIYGRRAFFKAAEHQDNGIVGYFMVPVPDTPEYRIKSPVYGIDQVELNTWN